MYLAKEKDDEGGKGQVEKGRAREEGARRRWVTHVCILIQERFVSQSDLQNFAANDWEKPGWCWGYVSGAEHETVLGGLSPPIMRM